MFIYQITNKTNNEFYIGKTINEIHNRFYQHKYNALKQNSQTHLHRAIRKYGIENFDIAILEYVSNIQELNSKEIEYINILKPNYNMTTGGDGGDTSSSPNFKIAMTNMHQKRVAKDYATYGMLGKTQSEKFIKSIKQSNSCPVMCEGIKFSSVGEAQKSYPGISIRRRIDDSRYPQFYRLKEKTKRI